MFNNFVQKADLLISVDGEEYVIENLNKKTVSRIDKKRYGKYSFQKIEYLLERHQVRLCFSPKRMNWLRCSIRNRAITLKIIIEIKDSISATGFSK